MIKKKMEKVYYTSEIVTDVVCDKCGKSLVDEDSEIIEVIMQGRYFIEGQRFLERTAFNGISKELCRECINPMLELLDIPTDEIF